MAAEASLASFAHEVSRPDAEIDLGRAALVIATSEYPDLDVDRQVDRLAELAEAARPANAAADALERLHRLREYLFEEQGFVGNAADYYDPRNSFLNDVLERRLGIPITLSLLLIEVGRRRGLEVQGIGLPGHFIVGARVGGEHVLLDAFNGGVILTGDACTELVARALGQPVELLPRHFVPVTNRQFLTRMLANLKSAYWRREAWQKAIGVINRLLILNPKAAGEWRDRGLAWISLGNFRRGLVDWEHYLTEFPQASDHAQVKKELRRVRQRLAELN